MTYKELLKEEKWNKKRREILFRDKYKCLNCKSELFLQVHHKVYINGRLPWEYSNSQLVTLCDTCHSELHTNMPKHLHNVFTRDLKNKHGIPIVSNTSTLQMTEKEKVIFDWISSNLIVLNSTVVVDIEYLVAVLESTPHKVNVLLKSLANRGVIYKKKGSLYDVNILHF